MAPDAAEPIFFATPDELGAWLARHHADRRELVVGLYRKGTGRPSLTWPEIVVEALRYGWIDGLRRGLDQERYTVRLTPRRPRSFWSKVNIALAERLIADGRMEPAGLAAFEARSGERSGAYSYEQDAVALDPAYEAELRADAAALAYWQEQTPSYRRTATHWVMSARREETRRRRLATVVACSAGRRTIPALTRTTPAATEPRDPHP